MNTTTNPSPTATSKIPHDAFRGVKPSVYTSDDDVAAWHSFTGRWFTMDSKPWAGVVSARSGPLLIEYEFDDEAWLWDRAEGPDWSLKELANDPSFRDDDDDDEYSRVLKVHLSLSFRSRGEHDVDLGSVRTNLDARIPQKVIRRLAVAQARVFRADIKGANRDEVAWEADDLSERLDSATLEDLVAGLPARRFAHAGRRVH